MKNRIYASILAVAAAYLALGSLPIIAAEQSGVISKTNLVQKVSGGEIDWGAGAYYATGEGLVPSQRDEPNRAKAYLKARGYARMKAIANLLMVVEGTTISYQCAGRDLTASESIRQTIEGYVRNVEMVDERQRTEAGETIIEVTVRTPIYGPTGPGSVLLEKGAELDRQRPTPVKTETKPGRATDLPRRGEGPFSSLVVDTRGLSVQRAMSPKIRRTDGSEIWGTCKVDYDFLQEKGIVAYALSVDDVRRNRRAGDNPLWVQAVGRAGGNFMCDAVVSPEDASLIAAENQKTKFLDKFNVIFIVDPKP
jgi:hypothetical protein